MAKLQKLECNYCKGHWLFQLGHIRITSHAERTHFADRHWDKGYAKAKEEVAS